MVDLLPVYTKAQSGPRRRAFVATGRLACCTRGRVAGAEPCEAPEAPIPGRRRLRPGHTIRHHPRTGDADEAPTSMHEEADRDEDQPDAADGYATVPVAGALGQDGDAGQHQRQLDAQLTEVEEVGLVVLVLALLAVLRRGPVLGGGVVEDQARLGAVARRRHLRLEVAIQLLGGDTRQFLLQLLPRVLRPRQRLLRLV